MKRSEINSILRDSIDFLARRQFLLPPFANWSPEEWKRKGAECREIAAHQLGWDITDFGSGRFGSIGLFLFTLRNGSPAQGRGKAGKTYAEKVMIVQEDQVTPTHFHHLKMEDIINRGGGNLLIRVWNADPQERLAETPVSLSVDGVAMTFKAGDTLRLQPGESVCLPQRAYHRFWGEPGKGTVLVGEVSLVNDDHVDNRFLEPVGRFPAIEEDEQPLHLLVGDYGRYYRA